MNKERIKIRKITLVAIGLTGVVLLGILMWNFLTNHDRNARNIADANGLLFSVVLNTKDRDCVPVKLSIYDDGKYEFRNSFKYALEDDTSNPIYDDAYAIDHVDYDALKIISKSVHEDKVEDDSTYAYKIVTGKGDVYYANDDNEYLMEYLNKINFTLADCAFKSNKWSSKGDKQE